MPGKPAHVPTPQTRAEVSALKSFGVPLDDISAYIGIDRKTLSKYYRVEIDTAQVKADAAVAKFLYSTASGRALKDGATYSDCVRSAMFWAKTRMGWREKDEGTQVQVGSFTVLDPETYKQARKEILRNDDC